MPGKEIKGRSKIANYRYGGRTGKQTGGRTNLLEELGRVEAEPSNRNRRAEISRVHGELNRGYKTGGRTGFAKGKGATRSKPKSKIKSPASFKSKWGSGPKPGTLEYFQLHTQKPKKDHHAFKKGGHVNTSRENRLEELGRVDAEKAFTKKGKKNLKAEKKRIVKELT